jgi:lipoprotein NlpD
MAYREKNGYDDMGESGSSRHGSDKIDSKSRRVIVAIVVFVVVLCTAVIAIWILGFPSSDSQSKEGVTTLIVDPIERPAPSTTAAEAPSVSSQEDEAQAVISSDVLVRTGTPNVQPTVTTPVPTVREPISPSGIVYTRHVVKEGETLDSIAAAYSLSKETIISVNAIKNISAIRSGEILSIPDRNGQIYTVQSGDSLSIITNRYNPTLGWKTLQELNGLTSEVIHPGQKLFIPTATVESDGSFADYNRFVKPAPGRIVGLYGQQVKYGVSELITILQGIWIDGQAGSDVIASGTGVVVDSGNNPENLGRFVVISHADGYRTTYGHLESISVKVGDQVKQGDIVGTMGSTGSIGKTTLYFSLEQEGTALNPENFF